MSLSDLVPGQPLAWDLFDPDGSLLRPKGARIADGSEAQSLITRGAIAPLPAASVLRTINQAHMHLEYLLFNLERESAISAQVASIAATLTAAVDTNRDLALATILLNQDEGTYAVRHCVDSAIVALLVARDLDKTRSELRSIMAAALTMNVGMLHNQEQFQSRLNAISGHEQAQIRAHAESGVALLKAAGVADEDWLSCVLLHHENEDGSGYPFGRMGDDIPLSAKIVSLADRYCARVSARGYRKALLPNEALNDMLVADQGSIDPMLTACLIRAVGIYPTGSVVRLANQEIGVVASQTSAPTTPEVLALVGADGARLSTPQARDTSHEASHIRELLSGEQSGYRFAMSEIWGESGRA